MIVDLNEEKGTTVASELGGLFVKCNVASEEDVQAAVDVASEMGPLRALVNSAGLGSRTGPSTATTIRSRSTSSSS